MSTCGLYRQEKLQKQVVKQVSTSSSAYEMSLLPSALGATGSEVATRYLQKGFAFLVCPLTGDSSRLPTICRRAKVEAACSRRLYYAHANLRRVPNIHVPAGWLPKAEQGYERLHEKKTCWLDGSYRGQERNASIAPIKATSNPHRDTERTCVTIRREGCACLYGRPEVLLKPSSQTRINGATCCPISLIASS